MDCFSDYASWYRGRTVVVTGGYGYLGSGLSTCLRNLGANLRRATRGRSGLENDMEAWIGDLNNPEFCGELVRDAAVIFHLSGQTSIRTSFEDPIQDLRANVESTLNLLRASASFGHRPAFVYGGTATELGLTVSIPIPAQQADLPITVYDANKLAAEHLIGVYAKMSAVAGLTIRIANLYGPGAKKSAADRGVTNKMITRALHGKNLTYYGDGSMLRDYIYIDDLLDVFLRAAMAANDAKRRSYIACSGTGYSLRDTFELISDVVAELGYERVKVESVAWPPETHPIDRRTFVGDPVPLQELCNWRAKIPLRGGISLTACAFQNDMAAKQN